MGKPEVFQEVEVRLPYQSYTIYIGRYLLKDAARFKAVIAGTQVLIVTNTTLAPLYLNDVRESLQGVQCDVVILPDGEEHKTQTSITVIHEALIQHKHHRDTTLIALGGGVIGDITGFAASTYHRGVAYIQIPTTLLAQVDSAVGGKTAINYPNAKNAVGSFHQPRAVFIDVEILNTLPEREFRAGLGEVIKYGLLTGGDFFKNLPHVLCNKNALSELIADCCRIKASIVQQDEQETRGIRTLLNLGHTFAHALEAATHYERWLHGEAVSIGLYCAAQLSHQLGYLSHVDVMLIDRFLELTGLPRRIPSDVSGLLLYECMQQDKKIHQNTLHFILMKAPGDCYVETQVSQQDVMHVLADAVSFT